MASIEMRATGDGTPRWRVLWREDGKRQQQTFRIERRAIEFRQRVEGHGNKWPPGEDPRRQRSSAGLTFGQWALTAIDRRTRASDRTKADYRRDLERHMGLLLDVPLADLDTGHVAAWVENRRNAASPLSDKTLRNLHGFASSIMVDALAQHPPLALHNPFAGRLGEGNSVHTEEMVFLTPGEFEAVFTWVRGEYRPLIRLLFGTGLRFGEATALTVRDVDLLGTRKTLTVTKAWKRTGPATWVVGEPKTRRSRRTVSLSGELVDMLIPLVSARRGDELLFAGAHGLRLPHSEVYKRGWAPAAARANVCDTHYEPQRDGRNQRPRLPKPCACPTVLGKTPRIHDLRHSHASLLIAEGVQLAAISRRLGHSSITITVDRYGHLDPALDLAINTAVDKALARCDTARGGV